MRNLFKYSKFYSGKDPEFIEGDIFRIIVPLNDRNMDKDITQSPTQLTQSPTQSSGRNVEKEIIRLIKQEPALSQKQMAERLCLNQNTLKYYIKKMKEKHIIERVGSSRKGKWVVK